MASALVILGGGVVLAAAKVLPSMAFVGQYERPPMPEEVMSLEQLWRMYFDCFWRANGMKLYHWEYLNFLGWCGALLVLLAAAGARRGWPWLIVAALTLALTIGSFDPWAPYSLLRRLPVFESLRVPSRYTLLAVFALAMAAAAGVAAIRAWLDSDDSDGAPSSDESDTVSDSGRAGGGRGPRAARWRQALHAIVTMLGLAVPVGVMDHGWWIVPGFIYAPCITSKRMPARWRRSISTSPMATAGVSTPARSGKRARSRARHSADSAHILAVSP
jgi:hypothetical protein